MVKASRAAAARPASPAPAARRRAWAIERGAEAGTWALKVLASTLPSTATPSADPACWMVSLSAEPTPACSEGTAPMSAAIAAGCASPPPTPKSASAAPTTAKPSPGDRVASRPNPATTTTSPAAVSGRLPTLLPRVAATLLAAIRPSAIGTSASPVRVAE